MFLKYIYNYIPETDRVSRVYCVADVLFLQFVLHVMLSRITNLRSMYAVPNITCFLQFLNFVLSWYIAHVLSE